MVARHGRLALVLLAAAATAALVRSGPPHLDTSLFAPMPDGLEYAAGAQSIVQDGRYVLNVGPWTAPPRYPPGYPMLLALALLAGVQPVNLVLVTQMADLGLVIVAGVAAAGIVLATTAVLAPERLERARRIGAPVAAAVAGLAIALNRSYVLQAKMIHSDSPTVLVAALAWAAWIARFWPNWTRSRRLDVALCAVAGVAAGWVALSRPVEALLLAPVLAVTPVVLGERRPAVWLRAAAIAALAAALPVIVGELLLLRSDRALWPWTAYDFWQPRIYGSTDGFLGWKHFAGPWLRRDPGPTAHWPGWLSAVATVTGLPLRRPTIGPLWPLIGWLTLALLVPRLARRRTGGGRAVAGLLALLAVWSLAHVAFFSFYFYRAPRFHLVATLAAIVMTAVAVGLLVGGHSRPRSWLGALLALAVIGTTVGPYRRWSRRASSPHTAEIGRLASDFERWLALDDGDRRQTEVPIDPLRAQALGWLDRERAESIREWGALPSTMHTQRLRRLDRSDRAPRTGSPEQEP